MHRVVAQALTAWTLAIAGSALADPTVSLTWTDTDGIGTTGGSTIVAEPGDTLRLLITVVDDGSGIGGALLSLNWDGSDLVAPFPPHECPGPENQFAPSCTADGLIVFPSATSSTPGVSVDEVLGIASDFDAFAQFPEFLNGDMFLGAIQFVVQESATFETVEVDYVNTGFTSTDGILTGFPVQRFTPRALATVEVSPALLALSDASFDWTDWTTTIVNQSGSALAPQHSQQPLSGVLGVFRFMQHPFAAGAGLIEVYHEYTGDSFDPSVLLPGEGMAVEYEEDRSQFNPPFAGAVVGAAPALRQGGIVYAGPAINFTQGWVPAQLSGLGPADFTEIGGSAHPDFTSTGGVIHFGFIRRNSTGFGGFTVTHAIDNWSVVLLPEPGGLLMLGPGIALLVVLGRARIRR
jgi:hypothetical protein